MGITQHKRAVATIQMLVNLMLLRGHIGRPGAGICPVRGHSNVQGDRTMGIHEKPAPALLDRLGEVFGFEPPREHGVDVVGAIEAMRDGRGKVFFAMGGNFATATPDTEATHAALRNCDLTVHVATKLNRSHLVHGKDALILPCLGRTEIDLQAGGPQAVTVEDSMSMVHLSAGINAPASPELLSEPAIVARLAQATLGKRSDTPWRWLVEDYDRIRDQIARVFEDFHDFNQRVRVPGGFRLTNTAALRQWKTATGKANFFAHRLAEDDPLPDIPGAQLFTLTTVRSHDQYNTTIYGLQDRYRGVHGERRVLFAHADDIAGLGFAGRPARRYRKCPRRRRAAHRARLPAGRLRHPARLPGGVLPRDQSTGAAGQFRHRGAYADQQGHPGDPACARCRGGPCAAARHRRHAGRQEAREAGALCPQAAAVEPGQPAASTSAAATMSSSFGITRNAAPASGV
jgi:molybdopterin-dependent oxidoreductase alpha subunit